VILASTSLLPSPARIMHTRKVKPKPVLRRRKPRDESHLDRRTPVGQNLTGWIPLESEVMKIKPSPIDAGSEILT
jgi:hypothetical protein